MSKPDRLPPLKALRVFEAAVRTGSFTVAAGELHITHSAVSQQIKLLEGHFGLPLFSREPRGVTATPQAKVFYEEVRAALDRIALAAGQLSQSGSQRSLRVSTTPSLAMRWLIPRLSTFQIANPRIQVLISTSVASIRELKEPYDVILRRTPMARTGFECVRFLDDVSGPVASPRYLARKPVAKPADLLNASLLHLSSRPNAWTRWLALAGVKAPPGLAGASFEHFFLSQQAAADDLGVAMGSLALVESDLESGRLVRLFPQFKLREVGFQMLYRAQRDPALRTFTDWLLEQGAGKAG